MIGWPDAPPGFFGLLFIHVHDEEGLVLFSIIFVKTRNMKRVFVVLLFGEKSAASGIEGKCIHIYCSTFEVMLNSVLQSYS